MKKLGIIGGLGPLATMYLCQLIVEMTDAKTDQEHIEMLIHNCPSIPDRTSFLMGKSDENPLDRMLSVGKELEKQSDILAIPCITAHYFYPQLEKDIRTPIIHAVRETARYLKQRNISNVGVLATDATVKMNIFKKELDLYGISSIYPDKEGQKDLMHLIYQNVKAGLPIERDLFERVADDLRKRDAQVIILGCTELSILKKNKWIHGNFLDVTEVLAKACVEQCATLKEEYKELISTDERD